MGLLEKVLVKVEECKSGEEHWWNVMVECGWNENGGTKCEEETREECSDHVTKCRQCGEQQEFGIGPVLRLRNHSETDPVVRNRHVNQRYPSNQQQLCIFNHVAANAVCSTTSFENTSRCSGALAE